MSFRVYFYESMSYETYCAHLDLVNEGMFDSALSEFRSFLNNISSKFKVSYETLLAAFKSKNLYNIMSAFGFSLKKMWECIVALSDLELKGLHSIFHAITHNGTFKKIQSGAMKVDEVLNDYPILKRLIGPALAGLLLFIWFKQSHIGNPAHDWKLSSVKDALTGKYSISDLFTSSSGLEMLTTFALGATTEFGIHLIHGDMENLVAAIIYTGLISIPNKGELIKSAIVKIKTAIA